MLKMTKHTTNGKLNQFELKLKLKFLNKTNSKP